MNNSQDKILHHIGWSSTGKHKHQKCEFVWSSTLNKWVRNYGGPEQLDCTKEHGHHGKHAHQGRR